MRCSNTATSFAKSPNILYTLVPLILHGMLVHNNAVFIVHYFLRFTINSEIVGMITVDFFTAAYFLTAPTQTQCF